MYKKIRGTIHTYHSSKLLLKSEKDSITTRQAHDVVIAHQKHSILYKTNSLNYKIGKAWNALPTSVKEKTSFTISTFTRSVKKSFLSKYRDSHYCGNQHCYICK